LWRIFFIYILYFIFETNERELPLQKSNQTKPQPVPARAGHRTGHSYLPMLILGPISFQRGLCSSSLRKQLWRTRSGYCSHSTYPSQQSVHHWKFLTSVWISRGPKAPLSFSTLDEICSAKVYLTEWDSWQAENTHIVCSIISETFNFARGCFPATEWRIF
jgi:hypothetical protein